MEHNHEHTHTHMHGDGEHTHTHTHPHVHEGHEDHNHTHAAAEGEEKTTAVLQYMLDHNVHHCAELKEMAAGLAGEAQHQLLHAVECFDQANAYLSGAIAELKK